MSIESDTTATLLAMPTGTVGREQWLRRYPIALGLGGLSGAWRTAVGLGAPAWPAVSLAALCLGVWTTVTVIYVMKGGGDPRALSPTCAIRNRDSRWPIFP